MTIAERQESKKELDRRALAGLQLYQKGQTGEALANWLHVLAFMPDHDKCQRYVRQAVTRYKSSPPKDADGIDEALRYFQKGKAFAIAGNKVEALNALNVAQLLSLDGGLATEVRLFRAELPDVAGEADLAAMGLSDLVTPASQPAPASSARDRVVVAPARDTGSLSRDDDGLLVIEEAPAKAAKPAAAAAIEQMVAKGRKLFEAEQFREAEKVWNKVIEQDPNHVEAYEFLLYTRAKLKELETADLPGAGKGSGGTVTRPVRAVALPKEQGAAELKFEAPLAASELRFESPAPAPVSAGSHTAASSFTLDFDEPEPPISLLDGGGGPPLPPVSFKRAPSTSAPARVPSPSRPAGGNASLLLDDVVPPAGTVAPAAPATQSRGAGFGLEFDLPSEPVSGPPPVAPPPPAAPAVSSGFAASGPGGSLELDFDAEEPPSSGPAQAPAAPARSSGGGRLELSFDTSSEGPALESAADAMTGGGGGHMPPPPAARREPVQPMPEPVLRPVEPGQLPALGFGRSDEDAARPKRTVLDAAAVRRGPSPLQIGAAVAVVASVGGWYLLFQNSPAPAPQTDEPPVTVEVPVQPDTAVTDTPPVTDPASGSTSTAPDDLLGEPIKSPDVTDAEGRGPLFSAGLAAFRAERFEEAIETFRKISESDPDYVVSQSYVLAAEQSIRERLRREAAAERLLKSGEFAMKNDDIGRAEDFYRALLELDAGHPEGKARLAEVLEIKERNRRTREKIALGKNKMNMRDYEGAVKEFQAAVEIDPKNRDALFFLEQAESKLRGAGGR